MSHDYDRTKTAAAKFDPRIVTEIGKMRDRNDHTGAYIKGSEMIGATRTAQKLKLFAQLKDLENHSTAWLMKYQYQLYEEMLAHAKRALDPEEYEQFYGAF